MRLLLPFLLACGASAAEPVESEPVWSRPRVPEIRPFEGTTGLTAASCGECHTAIYQEWRASTHAAAWIDPQFQAELHKDPGVGWLCLNCHTPLAAQQPSLVVEEGVIRDPETRANPAFDPGLRDEGITCLTCHWRPEGIAAVHPDAVAPHPLVHAPELREVETCTTCHQAKARLERALVCHFDTGTEWAKAAPGATCQGCHMEAVTRSSVPGAPPRDGGRHLWPGSLLPKAPLTAEQEAMFDGWKAGTDAALTVPERAAAGDRVVVVATLANVRAGHQVPTGDPERHLVVTLRALDARGGVLAERTERIGQSWVWWPEARQLADDRLAPGERRAWPLDFAQPAGGATVELVVEHVRITDENAAFHALDDYARRRTVHAVTRRVAPSTPAAPGR